MALGLIPALRAPRSRASQSYLLNRVCWRALHDVAFREQLGADPVAALAPLDVAREARDAFVAGDVAALVAFGVRPFLLGYLSRWGIAGLTLEVYNARMRSLDREAE